MVVSPKDSIKLFGIMLITCCAVTVCNMFINYYIDLTAIESQISGTISLAMYDAQLMTCKVVCCVSGGVLALTTVVMIFFYIKHYIDSHSQSIGILKALGHSDIKIAKDFSLFGLSVFIGCLGGYLISFALMTGFYHAQNKDELLPEISPAFHIETLIYLAALPAAAFALIAIIYSIFKINRPAVDLLKGITKRKVKDIRTKDKKTFIADMRSAVLRGKKTLIFFICFSAFCFSAMVQMSAGMRNLADEMFGIMIFIIGLVLAFTILYIAVTTVITSNSKNIAMMRVFGYQARECKRAVLDGYRLPAYIGFMIGTGYQFGLLKIMVNIVFANLDNVPEYDFDIKMFFITLVGFIVIYEGIMLLYSNKIKKIPIKQIME